MAQNGRDTKRFINSPLILGHGETRERPNAVPYYRAKPGRINFLKFVLQVEIPAQ